MNFADRLIEVGLVVVAIAAVILTVVALEGCDMPMPDLAPLDPNWSVPPVTVPIYPAPEPGKQHAKIELWGDIVATSKHEFLRGLHIVRTEGCAAELWLAIECKRCYRVHDFWEPADVPEKSIRCRCGEWLIRYLEE